MTTAPTRPYRNVVGGELVDGVEGAVREVRNPATGEVIAEVPDGSAGTSSGRWRPPARRGSRGATRRPASAMEALLGLAGLVERDRDELAELESLNVGKPMSLASEEMPICVDELRFFAGAARILHAPAAGEYDAGYTSFVRREPIGIVGQITPWNYPLMMAIWKIAPGARGGQRRRAQAVRAHAVDDAAPGRARGRASCRPAC